MKNRIIALLLILVLTFSLSACKSADEEEGAAAGEIVQGTDDDTNVPSDDNNDSTDTPADDTDTNTQPDNTNTNTTPDDDDGDDNDTQTPPLSTSGNYSVTFDFGYDNKSETEKTDGKATEMDIQRAGYEFEGWYNGNDKWDFSTSLTEDIKLTAKWKVITYSITYQANGATLPSGNPESYTVADEITLKAPEISGKIFLGWSINNGKESYTATIISKGTTGNLVLSPVWDENAVILGKYEQDGNEDNGKEDIIWTKLKEENGKVLLISKDIIECMQYDSKGGDSIRWATCSLRKWLNETFYKTAFSSSERNAIVQTEIHTPGTADNSTSNDYVFILSLEESKELIGANFARCASVTKYAEANGAQNSPDGGWWWLRTKRGSYSASLVENTGNVRDNGYTCTMQTIGVRPVIWVDMSKIS